MKSLRNVKPGDSVVYHSGPQLIGRMPYPVKVLKVNRISIIIDDFWETAFSKTTGICRNSGDDSFITAE